MEAHARWLDVLVLPFTIEHALIQVLGAEWLEFYVRRHRPNELMTRFGGDIKTAEPFAQNLAEIVEGAGRSRTPVLVMTFDWYEPSDYSLEAFQARELDFSLHKHATEIWGKPAHIKAGMNAHNDALRRYATDAPDHVIYLDVEPLIPNGRAHWEDICHFNEAGEALWLRAMAKAVGQHLTP